MTPPTETPKRKNGASKNRRRLLSLLILLISVGAVGLLLWSRSQPTNDLPTARLMYSSSDPIGFTALNLQTGETLKLPFEDLYNRELSPDGKWSAHWYTINLCCDASLDIDSVDRSVDNKSFGLYYGSSGSISWSSDSQWIAFSATPQANNYYQESNWNTTTPEEIYLRNIYTYEEKRLTNNAFTDRYPSISPDGAQIAYTSDADGVDRLYVMDIATLESRVLTPDREGYRASWSPDSHWIAFVTNSEPTTSEAAEGVRKNADLWLIRADGTGAQIIKTDTGPVEAFWLP